MLHSDLNGLFAAFLRLTLYSVCTGDEGLATEGVSPYKDADEGRGSPSVRPLQRRGTWESPGLLRAARNDGC